MKTKDILIISIALAIGLGIGYLLFASPRVENLPSSSGMPGHEHHEGAEEVWTCSMHPQIRQNEPGLCPICEMDLIPANSSSSNDPLVLEMTPEAVKLSQIETTVLGSTNNTGKRLKLSGKLQADERLAASQVAHIPGRIEQLFVTFTGEQIRQGQKLANVYSPELVAAQQELLEALKLKNVNPELANAARQKLLYWKIPEQTLQEIESSGVIKEIFTLVAEVGGTVKNRRVAVGDHLHAGDILFDIVSLNRLWVQFDAYEEDLAHIHLSDRVEFHTPALPGQTFSTRINFIDPIINAQTRTAAVRGEIANTRGTLKPEMFIEGELQARLMKGTQLLVPKTAVLWTGPRSVVYVKVPNTTIPSFTYRDVELGERMGDNYLVKKGLEIGEEVVTYGSFTIDAAAQLNNQKSMMNQRINIKGLAPPAIPDFTESTPSGFKQQLTDLALSYLPLKDALVATDPETSQQAVQPFLQKLAAMDKLTLQGDAQAHWIEQSEGLQHHASKIQGTKDIELQRKQFDFLSDLLINTIKSFGIEKEVLYIQHCPMAFDNTGAEWLSTEEGILNPYFGDKMLRCGLVQETLDENYEIQEGE